MKKLLLPIIAGFASIVVLGQGCQPVLNQDQYSTTNGENTVATEQSTPTDNQAPAPGPDTANDTQSAINDERKPIYEDFTQAKYEAALAAGEPVYLYYFATWCPTCRAQAPINERVFNSYNGFFHAYRINILDNDVNTEEEAIAKQYNVNRQHTAILIDSSGNEVKRTIGTRSNTQLINDLELITN